MPNIILPPILWHSFGQFTSGVIAEQPRITLGPLTLVTAQVISDSVNIYTLEHGMPGSQPIIERLGSERRRITIQGFFHSGSDELKQKMLDLKGQVALFHAYSFASGYSFVSGLPVYIDNVRFVQQAGKTYPYYEYQLYCVATS